MFYSGDNFLRNVGGGVIFSKIASLPLFSANFQKCLGNLSWTCEWLYQDLLLLPIYGCRLLHYHTFTAKYNIKRYYFIILRRATVVSFRNVCQRCSGNWLFLQIYQKGVLRQISLQWWVLYIDVFCMFVRSAVSNFYNDENLSKNICYLTLSFI